MFGGPRLLYRIYQCCCISKECRKHLFLPSSADLAVQAFPWLLGSRRGKAVLAEKLCSLTHAWLPDEAFPLQPYEQRVWDGLSPQLPHYNDARQQLHKAPGAIQPRGSGREHFLMDWWQILCNKSYHSAGSVPGDSLLWCFTKLPIWVNSPALGSAVSSVSQGQAILCG